MASDAIDPAAQPSPDESGRLWCRYRLEDVLPDADAVEGGCALPLPIVPFDDAADIEGRPLGECRNLSGVDGASGCRLVQRLAAGWATALAATAAVPSELGRIASDGGNASDELATAARLALRLGRSHGRVLIACPAGSRRYNLHGPDSDHDLAMVYRAPLRSLLGLPGLRPASSLQSSGPADPIDCRATELGRFLELLLAGDPKAVECLFLRLEDLQFGRPSDQRRLAWLFESRRRFLTPQLLQSYRSELEGPKGLRKLDRLRSQWLTAAGWTDLAGSGMPDGVTDGMPGAATDGGPKAAALGVKLRKLYCILLRLADCCVSAASGCDLPVRFESGSERHRLLTWVRFGPPSAPTQLDELRMRAALQQRLAEAVTASVRPDSANSAESFERLQAEANAWLVEHRLTCHAEGDEELRADDLRSG